MLSYLQHSLYLKIEESTCLRCFPVQDVFHARFKERISIHCISCSSPGLSSVCGFFASQSDEPERKVMRAAVTLRMLCVKLYQQMESCQTTQRQAVNRKDYPKNVRGKLLKRINLSPNNKGLRTKTKALTPVVSCGVDQLGFMLYIQSWQYF